MFAKDAPLSKIEGCPFLPTPDFARPKSLFLASVPRFWACCPHVFSFSFTSFLCFSLCLFMNYAHFCGFLSDFRFAPNAYWQFFRVRGAYLFHQNVTKCVKRWTLSDRKAQKVNAFSIGFSCILWCSHANFVVGANATIMKANATNVGANATNMGANATIMTANATNMTANATNMGANEANTKAKEREKKTVEKG